MQCFNECSQLLPMPLVRSSKLTTCTWHRWIQIRPEQLQALAAGQCWMPGALVQQHNCSRARLTMHGICITDCCHRDAQMYQTAITSLLRDVDASPTEATLSKLKTFMHSMVRSSLCLDFWLSVCRQILQLQHSSIQACHIHIHSFACVMTAFWHICT